MFPKEIYYEPAIAEYELGKQLISKYHDREWIPIDNHNNIESLRKRENKDFPVMKQLLIIGTRKTHKYTENHKVSDYLVPFTSSGCSAMCLYCYLVCNYNKCSYMRLFVNREKMMEKLIKTADRSPLPLTFEIGSNSDLILENMITENLPWIIDSFSKSQQGFLTFPTKFDAVDPLLNLEHSDRVIFRMSLNPQPIISKIEIGTSPLENRIRALNRMAEAGYKTGVLFAPVVLSEGYKELYSEFISKTAALLSDRVKKTGFIEIIFMTYSFVHHAINTDAFPGVAPLYDKERMTGRGRGKYSYKEPIRAEAEAFLKEEIKAKLPEMKILYIV